MGQLLRRHLTREVEVKKRSRRREMREDESWGNAAFTERQRDGKQKIKMFILLRIGGRRMRVYERNGRVRSKYGSCVHKNGQGGNIVFWNGRNEKKAGRQKENRTVWPTEKQKRL